MKKNTGKLRILTIICALTMVITMMPMHGFAASGEETPKGDTPEVVTTTPDEAEKDSVQSLPGGEPDEAASDEVSLPAEEPGGDISVESDKDTVSDTVDGAKAAEPKAKEDALLRGEKAAKPLTLVGSNIPVTAMTHLADGKQAVYVSFKVKNNSTETLEDVTLVESPELEAVDRYGSEYEWTPYSVNNFRYDSSGAHEVGNAEPNNFGYDIAPGATATFWLVVRTDGLAAGDYTHKIKLGRKEYRTRPGEDGMSEIYVAVAEVYTDDITVKLHTYNAPVKISVGKFVFPMSVTQSNTLNFGTYDLSSYTQDQLYSDVANYTIGINNVSTEKDPYTGEVPDFVYFYHLEYEGSPYNPSPVSTASLWDDQYMHTSAHYQNNAYQTQTIELNVKPEDWVEGTYTGNLVISTTPAKVIVNGGAIACDESRALVKVPFKVTFTGRNPMLPNAPTGLTATPGNGRVELSWSAATTANGQPYENEYCIYRREGTETETDWKKLDWSKYEELYNNPTDTFYVDDSVENGKTYSYVVFAGGSPRHGYPSDPATATPSEASGAVKLSAPVFSAYAEIENVELTWKLPENNVYNASHRSGEGVIDHFNIYRNGKLYAQVARNAVIDESHWNYDAFSGENYYVYDYSWEYNVKVEPQVVYAWQIAAVDMDGNEGYLSAAQDVAAATTIPVLDRHNTAWYSNYYFSHNGYGGMYYDPGLPEGDGSGLMMGVWSSSEYGSSITTLKITRRESGSTTETVLAEATPMNYVNGGTAYDWVDRTAKKGKTYIYTFTGNIGARKKTNSYSFAVKIPSGSSEEMVSYDEPYVEYSLKGNGTTPTLKIWRAKGSSYKIYRNGTLVKSYSKNTGDTVVSTWSETPEEDGTYVYKVERITDGVAVPGNEYTFVRDTTPTDESTLPKKPGTPTLTARLSDGVVVFSIAPSAEGGKADGYYVYRTDNGEYNENQWPYGDGERGEDYIWNASGRYIRLAPSRTSYNDSNVSWSGYDGWDEASQQYVYTQKEHKWWIVAYNAAGVSEPSEIVTYTDAPRTDGGEGYEAPGNNDTEAPGKPVITNAWMTFEDNYYQYDKTYDPTGGTFNAYVNYAWTESPSGGGADRFGIRTVDPRGHTSSGTLYLYSGKSYKDYLSMPENTGEMTVEVNSVNEVGESDYASKTLTVYGIPRLRLKDAGAGTVEVRFTAPVDNSSVVTAYKIERRSKYGLWGTAATVTPSSLATVEGENGQFYIYTDTGADEGGSYVYRVTAVCTDGRDRTSVEREITSTGSASELSAPSWKANTPTIRDGTILLEWNAPAEGTVDHYEGCQVEVVDGETREYTFDLTDDNVTSALYGSGLWSVGETHTLKVRAVNEAGEGPWSDEITFDITESALNKQKQETSPKAISLVATPGDGQVTLNWYRSPAESDEYGETYGEAMYYIIEKTRMPDELDDEQDETEIKVRALTQRDPSNPYEYIDEDVENGRLYRYAIIPVNSAGSSWPDYYTFATPNGPSEVDKAIEDITELAESLPDPEDVSVDDEETIKTVEEIWDSLPENVKEELPEEVIEKIEGVIEAGEDLKEREKYEEMIAPVQAMIDALPDPSEVTLDDEAQIEAAKEAVMRLDPAARKYLSQAKLIADETVLLALKKEQADKAAAQAVTDLIEDLPEANDVTLADGAAIDAVQEAYDALTDDQKAYVPEGMKTKLEADAAQIKELRRVDVAECQITVPDAPYTGSEVTPAPTVTYTKDGNTATLTQGTEDSGDYTVSYSSNVEVGTATVTITGRGDYKGTNSKTFRVVPADLSGAVVTGIKSSYEYTESAINVDFTVTAKAEDGTTRTLTEGTDYTVTYSNNVDPGTATVTITGKGNYSGEIIRTFEITEKASVKRIYGSTRYQTAILQADALKEELRVEKFDAIVVATGTNYADALSGAYLAYVKGAPILLVNSSVVGDVRAYIADNLKEGGTVYLLGGPAVVPDTVKEGLENVNFKRLYGATRYETNLEILKEANVTAEDILICDGNGFADSLSASAVKKPILLVRGGLNDDQRAYLDTLSTGKYYLIGGTGVLPEALENEVRAKYGSVKRLGGSDRFETSALVAEEFFGNPKEAVIAYGMNYPDGLCGGPLAAYKDAPLLLSRNDKVSTTAVYTTERGIKSGVVLGGPTLVSDGSVRTIFSMSDDIIQ